MCLTWEQWFHGCAAWEVWTRQYPYPGMSKVQIMFGVAAQDMRPEVPAGMPAWFSGMVTSCWGRDPRTRHVMQLRVGMHACLRLLLRLSDAAPMCCRPSFAEVRSLLTRELAAVQAAT